MPRRVRLRGGASTAPASSPPLVTTARPPTAPVPVATAVVMSTAPGSPRLRRAATVLTSDAAGTLAAITAAAAVRLGGTGTPVLVIMGGTGTLPLYTFLGLSTLGGAVVGCSAGNAGTGVVVRNAPAVCTRSASMSACAASAEKSCCAAGAGALVEPTLPARSAAVSAVGGGTAMLGGGLGEGESRREGQGEGDRAGLKLRLPTLTKIIPGAGGLAALDRGGRHAADTAPRPLPSCAGRRTTRARVTPASVYAEAGVLQRVRRGVGADSVSALGCPL